MNMYKVELAIIQGMWSHDTYWVVNTTAEIHRWSQDVLS